MDTNNIGQLTGVYISLRDRVAEIEAKHKLELAPLKEAMEKVEDRVYSLLAQSGLDSAKTENGTAYITESSSVTVADKSAFMDFIRENDAFDFLDVKANKTAVNAYLETNQALPPGVNINRKTKVGFRRA